MRKKIIWIVLAVALVGVLVVAGILYSRLSVKIAPETASAVQEDGTDAVDLAADFTVTDGNGDEDSLSAHRGKPVVVNFWATWCGFCVEEMPSFDAAAKKYADQIDFMMVDLTDGNETVDAARAFVQEKGFTFPVYYDTQASAANAYGVRSIPLTLFVSADGTLMDSHLGAMTEDMLEQNIAALLANE